MAEKFEYTRSWTDAKAFPLLGFTKSWENPEDYHTIELDETQVRKDMQSLHDEVKDYINTKLIPAVQAEDATEEARAAAEVQRETNENQRIENENTRIAAEQSRASAETARDTAEQFREAAEQARADETSGIVARATEQADLASSAATSAVNSAEAAGLSATAASESASAAQESATSASQERAIATSAASQASSAASLASEQKSQAQAAASNADKFATQARQHMEQSRTYSERAGTSENNAAQSAASAESAKKTAATSASSASAASSSAEAFKNAAERSAAAASTSETNAKASETAAKASENAAKASETAAKASETTAKSEADRAKSEADRAAGIVGGDFATKTDLETKQDRLTGKQGQEVGFDESGNAIAQDAVNPDWNQNASTSPDYIKNRICYKEFQSLLFSGDITLLPPASEGGTSSAKSVFSVPSGTLEETQTPVLKIVWDGISYELTPGWDSDWETQYVGNPNLLMYDDPGEIDIPFVFYPRYETSGGELNVIASPEQQGVHTIEFWSGLTYVKIPEEYLLNSNIRNGTGKKATESGLRTNARGEYSHAEGLFTTASGEGSHVEGYECAASSDYQHVEGKFNVEDSSGLYAHIVGNGNNKWTRSNAHTLDWGGNAWFAGTVEGTALILKSSTEGSTKRFRITVDDSGTLTATEITG